MLLRRRQLEEPLGATDVSDALPSVVRWKRADVMSAANQGGGGRSRSIIASALRGWQTVLAVCLRRRQLVPGFTTDTGVTEVVFAAGPTRRH